MYDVYLLFIKILGVLEIKVIPSSVKFFVAPSFLIQLKYFYNK